MDIDELKMGNTSRLDVFSTNSDSGFLDQVVPSSMTATLGPGDMLFFPPGWWHAMRSETTSFSVSMWFQPDLPANDILPTIYQDGDKQIFHISRVVELISTQREKASSTAYPGNLSY